MRVVWVPKLKNILEPFFIPKCMTEILRSSLDARWPVALIPHPMTLQDEWEESLVAKGDSLPGGSSHGHHHVCRLCLQVSAAVVVNKSVSCGPTPPSSTLRMYILPCEHGDGGLFVGIWPQDRAHNMVLYIVVNLSLDTRGIPTVGNNATTCCPEIRTNICLTSICLTVLNTARMWHLK